MPTVRVALIGVPHLLAQILEQALSRRGDVMLVASPSSSRSSDTGAGAPADLIITGEHRLLLDPRLADNSVLRIAPDGRSAILHLPGQAHQTYSDLSADDLVVEVLAMVSADRDSRTSEI